MDHRDHVGLLRDGVSVGGPIEPGAAGPRWADIGAGEGAFTLALAELLGPNGTIVALDRDGRALARNAVAVGSRFPAVELMTLEADLEDPPDLGELDGLVAANSLHFVPSVRQAVVIERLAAAVRPGGTVLVVEYDADRGNPWVPYPFSAARWPSLAAAAGLVDPRALSRVPSRFLGGIYSAAATRP